MKAPILLLFSLTASSLLNAQTAKDTTAKINQAYYQDTTIVERIISRSDTTYQVREPFRKGDWDLFWDYSMTKKMAELHFDKKGNKSGRCIEWYQTSKGKKSEFDYSNSWFSAFPVGIMYFPSGNIMMDRVTENDSLVETNYYEGGNISCIRKFTRQGLLCMEEHYCENGTLTFRVNPTSTTPLPVKKYSCTGNLKSEYNWYIYGYSGNYTEYHSDGKTISLTGHYQEYPEGSKGPYLIRKSGDWTYFDNKGKKIRVEKWADGKLVSTQNEMQLNN